MEPAKRKTLTLKDVKPIAEAPKRLIAGRYLLKGAPRMGGIASVYRALDSLEERPVAVKVFRVSHERDDIVEESFRRETSALSGLRHPNIVEILDSGVDENTGEHFIVMEWVDQDLDLYRVGAPMQDWKQLFDRIGRPVLEALAFAHTHVTVHRDIKPSNILITPEGLPKVCDFGISKIRNFLEPGVTLSQFGSIPFAPPELDDGAYSYTRDVFGFAALCVSQLAAKAPRGHTELISALEALEVEEPIKRLLRRCLSLENPGDRPPNAAVLLSEFDRLSPKPRSAKEGAILLAVTNKVRDILKIDVGATDDAAVQRFVVRDLIDVRVLIDTTSPKDGQSTDTSYLLLGSRYCYKGILASPQDRILLVTALDFPVSRLEEKRDGALEPTYTFAFSGTSPTLSALNIKTLIDQLVASAADQKAQIAERRSQAIFNTWLNLLNAKSELERQRRQMVQYSARELSGGTVRFTLAAGLSTAALDEQDIRILIGPDQEFLGSVVSLSDDSLLVTPNERNRVETGELPDSGTIIVDTTKTNASLDKQRTALDAVRYGKSVNPTLGGLIASPNTLHSGNPTEVEFIQKNIDDDKKIAVRIALGKPDLLVIQGPPGTGKTTFITEVVLQTLKREPESRILLTSQTHVALDNSLENITGNGNIPAWA